MELIIRNNSGQPIYDQISAQIKAQILSGALSPGDGAALHPWAGQGPENIRHHHQAGL